MNYDSGIKDVLAECLLSTKVCAKTLFPDLFYAKWSVLHEDIFRLIDSGAKKIAIAAPRGIGKTTIVRTLAAKSLLFRDTNFITYVSNSATSAEMQTENLKRELITNETITKLFGNIKISDTEGSMEESFSKTSWVAFGNTLVMPRGSGQQVRGLVWGKYRPQLIIVDDLENADEIMNEEQRWKVKNWFHSDLEKCVNNYANDWRIIYIDTLKHEDSLLQELLDASDWESITLSICDDKYNSLAPEYMTTEEIKAEVESYREKGLLDVFYRERMNIATSREDASFKSEYFKYYEERDIKKGSLETVIIVDPAKTVKMQSADSAIVAVGIDYQTNGIYFRDCVAKKLYPDELYNEMFDMAARFGAHTIGVEVTGLDEFIRQPIVNEMQKRGPKSSYEMVWLHARSGPVEGMRLGTSEKGKIKRIASLVPYYRQGYVYHNSSCCAQLEAQLLSFPRSKRFDVMDAFAYIIEMMDFGDRYFSPPSEDPNDSESEFEELEYEVPLRNWRVA